MKKRILSLLTVLLVAMILTSTVGAGGNVGFSKVQFSLGSLDVTGTLTGLGGYTDGVTVDLTAMGNPVVTCTSRGGNEAPGQNPSQVSANGTQIITEIFKNGTAPVEVKAVPGSISAKQGGCPNKNWTAEIVSVLWTDAVINVYDSQYYPNGGLLLTQVYKCDPSQQTETTVTCTLVSETSYH